MNKQILIGRLGTDPEIKHTQSGTPVCNFSMATSEKWKKDGEPKEKTTWHRVVCWGKVGEIIGEYCKKGDQLYIEGKTEHNKYTDKDGVERWQTQVNLEKFEFIGGKKDQGGDSGYSQPVNNQPINEDDIPF